MIRTALKAALPYSLPVMAGYFFLSAAYGIYMHAAGFSFWYPAITALLVYGGSLEFLLVSLLLAPFNPLQTFIMSFLVQARHLFYGLSMLDRFKDLGPKKYYMIYTMSDETFSLSYAAKVPDGVDKGWFMFWISLLDQASWVAGAATGGILGSFIPFDLKGIDFMMTAMFVVIFLEQLLKEKKHYTAIIGLAAAILCRLLFSSGTFLIPTMLVILVLLTLFRKPITEKGGYGK